MKTSFWRRWCDSLRRARPAGPVTHARPPRPLLRLQTLEDRVTPTLTPQMVLDINTKALSANPSQVVAVGSTTYFTADDGVHGVELWKSDGTAAGTTLVKDIYPGIGGSSPVNLTDVNGTLYFSASDATGRKLWKSDGTAAGTTIVKSISVHSLTNVSGTLFIAANNGFNGVELWKSDGTTAGTVLVKQFSPGTRLGSTPTNVNGTLFFVAGEQATGLELWKSDGTAAGTVLVKDIDPGTYDSDPRYLLNVNGTLFFRAFDVAHGTELWKSDGTTAGTTLVKDIYPGSLGANPYNLTNVNGTLFFSALDPTNGFQLWKSDGTAAGTTLVKDISIGTGGSSPLNLTDVNGTLFFAANDGVQGWELWKSDGTAAGTTFVKDINPGISSSSPVSLTDVNGTLFFTASDTTGRKLWKSDGTAAGTTLVKGISADSLTNVSGTLFFAADDGVNGVELWKSDGTTAGTTLVKDINTHTDSSSPVHSTDVNGTLFFAANDGVHGWELWKSDGTAAGTTLVKEIYSGSASSSPGNLTNVNGTLFFTAHWQLWKSDGTAAGTTFVKGIYADSLTNVNGTLFFTADDGNGVELWKSDGTTAGTTMVKDIYPGMQCYYSYWSGWQCSPASSFPSGFTNVNGTLFFTAGDDTTGYELWKSDGTEAGTVLVKDINPGGDSSFPSDLTNVNGTLFFEAGDGTAGSELWKSDGTEAGTVLVKDIYPGSAYSLPRYLTDVNGTLFFSATDGVHGTELWKSDGTAAGTVLVKDLVPGSGSSFLFATDPFMTDVNGTLFFVARDGATGAELWRSDGTAAGTVLVADVNPGVDSSSPTSLVRIDDTLYFSADDGSRGKELWMSAGTTATTSLVGDINPGADSSNPDNLTAVNGALFFSANDGTHGDELWRLVSNVPPDVTITDATATEGNAGTTAAEFTVRLSAPSSEAVSVHYSTDDGTATAGSDYQPADGVLNFAPGETVKTIPVLVNGDRLAETNEWFVVHLTEATNANVFDGEATGTILDDEPFISIGDVSRIEGNSGTTAFSFAVSLSAATEIAVTVDYSTADGSATASSDYRAASETLTFAPGETQKTITVLVNGDRLGEPNEFFHVNLNGAPNAHILDGQGVGTIFDDEPRISITDVTRAERRRGHLTAFTFTVTLSAAYDRPVKVLFHTVNGTARAGEDYVVRLGTLTFTPGQTRKTITVLVKGDARSESDEEFFVDLTGITDNLWFNKSRGVGTVLNDD